MLFLFRFLLISDAEHTFVKTNFGKINQNQGKIPFLEKTTMMVTIFWDFLIFYQIFLSPKVTRGVIISIKHGTFKLPAAGRVSVPTQETKIGILGKHDGFCWPYKDQIPRVRNLGN